MAVSCVRLSPQLVVFLFLLIFLAPFYYFYSTPEPIHIEQGHRLDNSKTNLSYPTCNITIVTAYYKIRSKHSHTEYTRWMTNFLSMPDCLVIFVDPGLEPLIKRLRPASLPTLIIAR